MSAPVVRFLPLPAYATAGAAGFDLRAAEGAVIVPGARHVVPTGFAVAVPQGWEMQIRPRSGLATRHGVTVMNSPGTVDSDYRGPLMVCLVNLGAEAFRIARGDRIAQAVIAPAPQLGVMEVGELDATVRGERGFGSTGVG